eukprot:CAMPEP_0119042044 /NCGR_PEP_ID=MMETSP1177-20130426/14308_1 /TAXON_ID=2985 /ORGANISM="Ochromonas sp, Strain CCMP1899" /LENGTH=453 /DNA_ID=CAMNT_0007008547 /DNA_START=63 /DNA_END=1421 /DNA_ORIENTATION=+
MVVLSIAICTKNGKALISRQFVEMNRIRIEGLLAAFPKLLGTDSKQHTFVETESVRYLYQPMDSLYLLLITNRASNIVEDLETLRLLSKVVPDVAGTANNLTEEKITDKCFELMFAFDEVITAGGYREPITLPQIRTNMEMESHEEKLHNMIKISKMETAKDQARDAARTIRDRQREQQRLGLSPPSGMGGGGSDTGMGSDKFGAIEPSIDTFAVSAPVVPAASSSRAPAVKGMSLSAMGGKTKSLEEALVKEDKLSPIQMSMNKASISSSSNDEPVPDKVQLPIGLVISEKVCCAMSRDGMVESFEIKGSLTLTAMTEEAALCAVQLEVAKVEGFSMLTHPKVDKAQFEKTGLVQLKDANKGFPAQRPVGILKWTFEKSAGRSDDFIPIKINCWPEEEGRGRMNVSIEYSMDQKIDLHDVRIHIPLGTTEAPTILNADGSYKHNSTNGELLW